MALEGRIGVKCPGGPVKMGGDLTVSGGGKINQPGGFRKKSMVDRIAWQTKSRKRANTKGRGLIGPRGFIYPSSIETR